MKPYLLYDSVWDIGDSCAAQYFLQSYFGSAPHGPFTWLTAWSLNDAVDILLSDFQDLFLLEYLYLWKGMVINTEKNILLMHLFTTEENGVKRDRYIGSRNELIRYLPEAKTIFNRRRERFYATLNDEKASPLLVWLTNHHTKEDTRWANLYNFYSKGTPLPRYDINEAREALGKIRARFPAKVQLLYLGYTPGTRNTEVLDVEEGLVGIRTCQEDQYLNLFGSGRGKLLAKEVMKVCPPVRQLYTGGATTMLTAFRRHMRKRIEPNPEVRSIRAYIFLLRDIVVELNLRYIPVYIWLIFYAQEEGIDDIVLVTESKRIEEGARLWGYRVITPKVYEMEWKGDIEYEVILDGNYPFHKPGVVRKLVTMAKRFPVACTPHFEVVVQNCKGNEEGEKAEMWVEELEFPYTLEVRDKKSETAVKYFADYERKKELLPNLIERVVLVQNQKECSYDYSDFIDSCDLIFRVNMMETLALGLYGERVDGIFCGDWSRFMALSAMRKKIWSIAPSPPLIYCTHGNIITSGDCPYAISMGDIGNKLYTAWWTTSALGMFILVQAFPKAEVYTTGISSLLWFNLKYLGNRKETEYEDYVWQVWEETGHVIDIMKDRDRYGKKNEKEKEMIVETEGEQKFILSVNKDVCLWELDQNVGEYRWLDGKERLCIRWFEGVVKNEGYKKVAGTGRYKLI